MLNQLIATMCLLCGYLFIMIVLNDMGCAEELNIVICSILFSGFFPRIITRPIFYWGSYIFFVGLAVYLEKYALLPSLVIGSILGHALHPVLRHLEAHRIWSTLKQHLSQMHIKVCNKSKQKRQKNSDRAET